MYFPIEFNELSSPNLNWYFSFCSWDEHDESETFRSMFSLMKVYGFALLYMAFTFDFVQITIFCHLSVSTANVWLISLICNIHFF